ncbi:hypothetical protein Plhal304r1_c023g0078611 [Plasmopara halstedii]
MPNIDTIFHRLTMGHTRYVFALSKYFDNVGRCIALDLDSMKTSSPFWRNLNILRSSLK